ncbi:MAG: zinc ribbon domain-containing protein, partial [Ruminiclostridium sp.]|nr:zinc ribbon domain-containing protein [Ruminiclostridium sp.]
MYCTQCGGLLPEEARFCPKCGTPAPADPVPEEPQVIPEQTEEPVDQPAPEEMPEAAGEALVEVEEEIPQDDWVPYIPEEFFDEEPRDFDGEPQEPEEEAATDKKRLKGLYIG